MKKYILLLTLLIFSKEIYCQCNLEWLKNKDSTLGTKITGNLSYLNLEVKDIDNDGDFDIFTGNSNGTIYYYENIGSNGTPNFALQSFNNNPLAYVNVDNYSDLDLVDIDNDGDLDAFIGNGDGQLCYYKNTGTKFYPQFTQQVGAANPFDTLSLNDYCIPTFVDIDNDNDFDAFLGINEDTLIYFQNVGTASNPNFIQQQNNSNPFINIPFSGNSFYSITFSDLDNDGDKDAFINEGFIEYYKNIGTSSIPSYSLQTNNENPLYYIDADGVFSNSFVDLDNDSDLDLLLGDSYGNIIFIKNTGSSTHFEFSLTDNVNPLQYLDLYNATPELVDINNDGLFDIFSGSSEGFIAYFKNIGTQSKPEFSTQHGSLNPFDSLGEAYKLAFIDIDKDLDFDAFVGNYDGTISYFKNEGTVSSPIFTKQSASLNPFNGVDLGSSAAPNFSDVDGDGDYDAIYGEYSGKIYYYKNTGTSSSPKFTKQTSTSNPFDGIDVGTLSKPTLSDLDNDGDNDALIVESNGTIYYYKNTGTSTNPTFTLQNGTDNPFNEALMSNSRSVTCADIDNDGDLDAFVGTYSRDIYFYENIGTANNPYFVQRFGNPNQFIDLDLNYSTFPFLVDIDNDADLDAFVGDGYGKIHFYKNIGTSNSALFSTQTGIANPFDSVIGTNLKPVFIDIDNDSDYDVFIGEGNGTILYYENQGDSTNFNFIEQLGNLNPLDTVNLYNSSSPSFTDMDNDGDWDAFIGSGNHYVHYYENIGTSTNPQFIEDTGNTNPFDTIYFWGYCSPAFSDVDYDGDYDAVFGEYDLIYYKNEGTSNNPQFVLQNGQHPFADLDLIWSYLTPNFADIDNDGFKDLFVGNLIGEIDLFFGSCDGYLYTDVSNNSVLTDLDLMVYPNPSSDILTIQITDGLSNKLSLFDIVGKIIYTKEFSNKQTSISVKNMEEGIYFLVLENNNGKATKKIIVKH